MLDRLTLVKWRCVISRELSEADYRVPGLPFLEERKQRTDVNAEMPCVARTCVDGLTAERAEWDVGAEQAQPQSETLANCIREL